MQRRRDKPVDLGGMLPFGFDIAGFDFSQTRKAPVPKAKRIDRARSKMTPLDWAHAYRFIKGRPFTLAKHRPLEQIYNDDHPHIVVMKPAQVGVSEFTLTRTMWALDVGAEYWGMNQDGLNVAYLFPTEIALRDFSKERFAKLRRESDYIEGLFTEYDDVTFKQAAGSFLYLRGASSPTQLLSFPADLLILDEFDRMPNESVALARERLRASEVKREIDISTPTLPGIGIDALYARSDQHVWQIHCAHCNAWIELDFFKDLRLDDQPYDVWSGWEEPQIQKSLLSLHCPACFGMIERQAEGKWVARFPDRTYLRGYHVPWYAFPSVDLHAMCIKAISQDPTVRTELFRSGLGLPFSESGSRITEDMLQALASEIPHGLPRFKTWKKTTMGIDVGGVYHYQIRSVGEDGKTYVRGMGRARDLSDLDLLIRQYRVRRVVIDAQPEQHAVKEWVAKHKGRVIRAFYTHGPRQQKDAMLKYDQKKRTVTIHRTMAMDEVYARVAAHDEHWPKEFVSNREIVTNMTAPIRIEKLDDHGQAFAVWEHTAPDHGFHACLYSIVAGMLAPEGAPGVIGQSAVRGWNP